MYHYDVTSASPFDDTLTTMTLRLLFPSCRFVNSVFFLLPKLHGVLKTHCLECVLSRAEVIPDIYMLLQTKGFVQMMAHRWDNAPPPTRTHGWCLSICIGVHYHSSGYVLLLCPPCLEAA